jgi:HPt (histidine-containing phosphotransfer) domain-containing protein
MIDLEAIRIVLGEEDDTFLAELVRTYLEETGRLMERLDGSAEPADAQEIRAAAHRLRGAAASLVLTELAAAWKRVEEAAGHTNATASFPELLQEARQIQDRAGTELDNLLAHLDP